ncbi:hypothetical protein KBB96_14300 [Luteolibacter ambystomatis]|uniref:Uncharacterized protein n=1 Tax=Luteolibacter ambystomatis TaxID=2824561 RepID=A0A975G6L0_9BACT|nr:hypothetical protein [Luteolibacter ambystomatis]QUE50034.1 hypothetical protein KBB96_14300 [Luteolibacter ambystomatis]
MNTSNTLFAIPTYRLRDVSETVEIYDEHFWRNGHSAPIMVFDDSSIANHQKYFHELEKTRTHNELIYVGPHEKERFIQFLNRKLRDKKLESLVRNLFRPSYGGNRNFTLMYTLGSFLVSADDDMRPDAFFETAPETLRDHEVCRGKLCRVNEGGYICKSFDILSAFKDVLGKRVSQMPPHYEKGGMLIDTAMDLETNTSTSFVRDNSLLLEDGKLPKDCVVKIAQTYRTGTNDIDALDYVHMFLGNPDQVDIDALNDVYVLSNFRPVVTKKNWRIDCGVAGYDNRLGLPPFFPTRLRFEDYIYRLWVMQPGIAAAHVDAVQRHTKNNYMRNPLAMEVFNEELCSLLKRKIKDSVYERHDLGIRFRYNGEVTLEDSEEILGKIRAVHQQVLQTAEGTPDGERRNSLLVFAENLAKVFYGFEPDFFQQNVSRIVDDVISQIHASLELWPTLVEICYYEKDKRQLPQLRVKNRKARTPAVIGAHL